MEWVGGFRMSLRLLLVFKLVFMLVGGLLWEVV